MTVDAIALILLGILSYLGWRTGALGQVLRIVAALAVLFFGRIAAQLVRESLFGSTGIAEPIVEVTSYFLGATLLYAAIVATGWLVIRTMRVATPTLATMDRAGGAALGAVKAAVLIYVLVAGTLLLTAGLHSQDPDDRMHMRDGFLTSLAEQYDIFSPWKLETLESLHRFLRAGLKAREDGIEHVLREHEEAADLLRSDEVRELLEDEKLQEAIKAGKGAQSLADERIRKLLNDPRFMERLKKIDLEAIERDLTGDQEPAAPVDLQPQVPPRKLDMGSDVGVDLGNAQ